MNQPTVLAVVMGTATIALGGLYATEVLRPCPDGTPNVFRLHRSATIESQRRVLIDELLVKFTATTSPSEMVSSVCAVHGDIVDSTSGWFRIVLRRVYTPHGLTTTRSTLLSDPHVLSVDFNGSDARLAR